jgi:DnaJ-class molecular chaperone
MWSNTMLKDYYRLLGVERQATQEEIKKAFRSRAKEYHPDANGSDPNKTELFKEINEAYDVLGDPEKRARYDIVCHPGLAAGMFNQNDMDITWEAFLRAMFEAGPRMRGMGCRGRGFGRCGWGRRQY